RSVSGVAELIRMHRASGREDDMWAVEVDRVQRPLLPSGILFGVEPAAAVVSALAVIRELSPDAVDDPTVLNCYISERLIQSHGRCVAKPCDPLCVDS